ncbi:MAG: ATP-binding protein [Selenomonadaceae bacterium]|nr:ATP-binding protein [Selenomonadaceae bacterium]
MLQSKEFPARREILPQVLTEITAEVKKYFTDDKWINRLKVAAEEILVNIVDYSGSEKVWVSCEFLAEEKSLRFEFVDEGELYNPLEEVPQVDIDAEMDERQIGGLGIFLYETIMDKLEYQCDDGKNHLLAYKNLV